MAFSRHLQIDPGGLGTHTTIEAAVSAAVSGGVSASNRYWLDLAPADYAPAGGALSLPAGIVMTARAPFLTKITLTAGLDAYTPVAMSGVNLESSGAYALRYHQDQSGSDMRGWFDRCRFRVNKSHLGASSVVELTGSQAVGLFHAMNCYFYSSNAYSGSNPTDVACAVGVRVKSDYIVYGEFFGCHFKTSTGTSGTARPILVLNETTTPSTSWGYAHIVGDWEDVHGDNGITPHPWYLKSSNTAHEGAMLDVGYLNVFSQEMPSVIIDYAGPYKRSVVYSRTQNVLRSIGESVRSNWAEVGLGEEKDFVLLPSVAETRAPTVLDAAPQSTLWTRAA